MEHIDRIRKLSDIDYSKSAIFFTNTDFFYPLPHGVHRFPVVWFMTVLNFVKLMACFTSSRKRELAKFVKAVTSELKWFRILHLMIIQYFVYQASLVK